MSRLSKTEDIVGLYDRIGPLADITAFYVDPALERLTELADMQQATRVVEVGAGTGRYAAALLRNVLPPDARYIDLEPSEGMRKVARQRLAQWSSRTRVRDLDELPEEWYGAVDRYVATYVLNVLPGDVEIKQRLEHAHRALSRSGLICLVNQTPGFHGVEGAVNKVWMYVYRIAPALLGNCRPLVAERYLDESHWHIRKSDVVCRFGFCSEVLVAQPIVGCELANSAADFTRCTLRL